MNPYERMQNAKKEVEDFFESKRKALVPESEDTPYERSMKRAMLSEINAIAGDTLTEAIRLADKGKDFQSAIKKAEKKIKAMKKDFKSRIQSMGPNAVAASFGLPEPLKSKETKLLAVIDSL